MKNFLDDNYYTKEIKNIVGIDEAGRGPLAGPVVACALILKKDYKNNLINDSKKLNDKQRRLLYDEILANCLAYSVSIIEPKIIDQINILNATKKAMSTALNNLNYKFDLVLTDAVMLDDFKGEVIPIVKGDQKIRAIAAASIIAKVTRDNLMLQLHEKYPFYEFKQNKGYPTKRHLELLRKHGPLESVHRFSYKPVRNLMKITLL